MERIQVRADATSPTPDTSQHIPKRSKVNGIITFTNHVLRIQAFRGALNKSPLQVSGLSLCLVACLDGQLSQFEILGQ